jgi:hypothetical protein
MKIKRVNVAALPGAPPLRFWKASVYDSSTGKTSILLESLRIPAVDDEGRWQTAYDHGGALILRNLRALPRAWLAPEAERVEPEEALRRIQGTSDTGFDPWRTALLEGNTAGLESLLGGSAFSGIAKVTKRTPNGLVIDTSANQAAVLVVSEINYPGWIAWIDGRRAPVVTADYLLRSVVLPAGSHRVEMRYTAPAARRGAWISFAAVALILALSIIGFRRRRIVVRDG